MSEPLVECVPNFSEGRDARRVEAIVAAMRVEGVHLLDWSMDADHNRSVVTVAGVGRREGLNGYRATPLDKPECSLRSRF